MTGRSVPEWIGSSPDASIPKRVKLRIWEREQGRCYLSGLKINALKDAFDYEHVIPVGLDGSMNRESNIRLALKEPHKVKTANDRKMIAKADSQRAFHLGLRSPKGRGLKAPAGMKYDWARGRYVRETVHD